MAIQFQRQPIRWFQFLFLGCNVGEYFGVDSRQSLHLYRKTSPLSCSVRKEETTFLNPVAFAAYTWSFLCSNFSNPDIFSVASDVLGCEVTGLEIRVGVSKGMVEFVSLMLSLIIFCYWSVSCAIRRQNSAVSHCLQEATSQVTVSAYKIQASRVLLAAVKGFGIYFIPMTAMRTVNLCVHSPLPSFWSSFSTLFAFFSLWINPIIYRVMNRSMIKEFFKLLRCGRKN